jgi:hypothetical protein
MLWAGGMKHLLLSCILFAPGAPLLVIARREKGAAVFTAAEKRLFAVVVAGAVYGVYALVSGQIAINTTSIKHKEDSRDDCQKPRDENRKPAGLRGSLRGRYAAQGTGLRPWIEPHPSDPQ